MSKIPLHYQLTEFDCGPTSVLNAISLLFDREAIPPEIPKFVMSFCLDVFNENGEFARKGTSQAAMSHLCSWLNSFSRTNHFPILCKFYSGEEVVISKSSRIIQDVRQGGAVVIRVMYGGEHYVLLTGIDGDELLLFDPYAKRMPFDCAGIKEVTDSLICNRRIQLEIMNQNGDANYALCPTENRDALILFNQQQNHGKAGGR